MDNTDDAEKKEKFEKLNKRLIEILGIHAYRYGGSLRGPDEDLLEAKKVKWYEEEQSKK